VKYNRNWIQLKPALTEKNDEIRNGIGNPSAMFYSFSQAEYEKPLVYINRK
jgi:hypothetical protein